MIDLWMVYSFIKRLTTPFNEWDAFKSGVIDDKGNILKKINQRSSDEKETLTKFDLLVLRIKKLLSKVPGGDTKLASYSAALYLIHEHGLFTEGSVLSEEVGLDQDKLVGYVYESLEEDEGPTNSVGSGAIAGLGVGPDGEPGLSRSAQKRQQKRNKLRLKDYLSYNENKDFDEVVPAKSLINQRRDKKHPRKTIKLTSDDGDQR